MSGTKAGGQKIKETNLRKYGKNYYKEIGRKGGKAKVPKGFAVMDKEAHKMASKKGGTISKRPKSIKYDMAYEDIHTKPETKKLVYDTSNLGLDSNSVSNSGGVLRRAVNRLVK